MGREESINADKLIPDEDPAEPVYHSHPQVVPDRPRPRYRRQVADAYGAHRRAHDPFRDSRGEPPTYGDEPRKFDAWKRLTLIAREHAVRLRHYRADKVATIVDTEIAPQVRKLLRGVVAPEQVADLVDRFVELLWSEIER
jgi:hypothetical protein